MSKTKLNRRQIINEELIRAGFISPVELIKRGYYAIIGAREHGSPSVRKFLKDNGEKNILNIQLFRDPINRYIDKFINVLSLGNLGAIKKNLNYDSLFHLYAILYLDDGKSYRIEKNEVVKITPYKKLDGLNVNVPPNLTVNKLFANGENTLKKNFWLYSAKIFNCQNWIKNILKSSELLTKESDNFISQDTETLLSSLPNYTQKIINAITDLGARTDILISGKAIRRP